MKSILIQANAKININLEILNKRDDGYHNINSIFQSVNLSDFLLIEKNKNYLSGAIICSDSDNIIIKTQRLLEKRVNKKLPCQIHLQKTIPISAGLGGGSSNAAAVLVGLNLLYNLKLTKKELSQIGIEIGADVPFFIHGGTCQVSGKGEIIKKIKIKLPKFFILFRPHKRIETKMMFQLHEKTGKDFLTICKEVCPEIKTLTKYFNKFNLKLNLSGSGPTVFCETNSYQLAKKVSENYPSFNGDIFICHPQKEAIKIIK